MKLIAHLLFLSSLALWGTALGENVDLLLFRSFLEIHQKNYAENATEFYHRFEIFKDNMAKASHLQMMSDLRDSKGLTAYGVTRFMDLTQEEFQNQYLTVFPKTNHSQFPPVVAASSANRRDPPITFKTSFDWRQENVVTSVKDQRSCGACWAFTLAAVTESMASIDAGFQLDSLSAQQILDCSGFQNTCNGGSFCTSAYTLKQQQIQLVPDNEYPYTAARGVCKTMFATSSVRINSFQCLQLIGQEAKILELVNYIGPVGVAVDASTWQFYVGGIIQYHCDDFLNHAVTIVGYDVSGPVPYYIAKNSWGSQWGEKGYIYLAFGKNICGVAENVISLKAQYV